MSAFAKAPLLLILFIAYNLMVFTGPADIFSRVWFEIPMMNGAELPFNSELLMILAGLLLLYIEIFKATRTHQISMLEQSFSMILFIVFMAEFLLVKQAGSSTFLILASMQLLDVMAGFTISVAGARRDIQMG
ncbi:hypothetical protein [Candidatus Venteria ishoeyi]|uniref:Uncharacterized protein n=1 Tax=Candidatus Venteria ishoeyi TaxID=1899563 RepID=A0A1H6F881_9GAMM|nr:hypothetical protein [Candidatus Venteria ishoeyi]MDM8546508.1 hypothetical protein [Candidatus Venteria ishoeyi]SEH06332.1 Uncharacterised protein [Candidatus Venteria ishoeyi]